MEESIKAIKRNPVMDDEDAFFNEGVDAVLNQLKEEFDIDKDNPQLDLILLKTQWLALNKRFDTFVRTYSLDDCHNSALSRVVFHGQPIESVEHFFEGASSES